MRQNTAWRARWQSCTSTMKTEKTSKLFYTTAELAAELHVNRHVIGWLREAGLLKAVRIGRGYSFHVDQIKAFADEFAYDDLTSKEKIYMAKLRHGKRRTSYRSVKK